MEVTMTRQEGENVLAGLVRRTTGIRHTKVAYAINRNIEILEKEQKRTQKLLELKTEEEKELDKEFEKERIAICEKYAKKKNGQAMMERNGTYIFEDYAGFKAEFDALTKTEKYAALWKVKEEIKEGVKKHLEEEMKFDMFALDAKYLPHDIAPEQINPLMKFLVGEPVDPPTLAPKE